MAIKLFKASLFKGQLFKPALFGGSAPAPPPNLVWADRVWETSGFTGTGNVTLGGAVKGKRPFAAVLNVGDVCYGCIEDQNNGPNWEVTQFTMNADGTLTRGTYTFSGGIPTNTGLPLDSSAGGAVVNFTPGVKNVFLHVPAFVLRASLVTPNFAALVR